MLHGPSGLRDEGNGLQYSPIVIVLASVATVWVFNSFQKGSTLQTIEVNKDELLKVLKTNRENHLATFEAASEVYRVKVIDWLERQLAEALNGNKVNHTIGLPIPEVHTTDYDRVIKMVEMHVGDTFQLDEHDAAQYIMDEWGWARSFAGNTTAYLVN